MQKNLLEYLEHTARRLGDKIAFSDERESVTFWGLNQRSRAIGTALAQAVPGANRPVAVLADRSVMTLTAMLGVLAGGCYYVPVDEKMPQSRMQRVLGQLEPAAVLYQEKQRKLTEQLGDYPMLRGEDCLKGETDPGLLDARRRQVLDVDPAYVIFTSGSTGDPKGIVVSHRAVIDFTDWYVEAVDVREGDRAGNQAPFFFDLSVKDIYPALKTGASVDILPQKCFSFPMLLVQRLEEQHINSLNWATSAFHLVANSGVLQKHPPKTVRKVRIGGEALQARQLNLWRKALPEAEFVNLYGPTEVTVDCCYFPIHREFADTEPIPIGVACENMQVILLREDGTPARPGEPGEICVRGSGLAQGYYGDWDKTAAAFPQSPMNPWYSDRMYRTGDIAVENERGELVFRSRKDGQIKHAGYRIELGEIETALSSLSEIQEAICLFDPGRDKIICVYAGEMDSKTLAVSLRGILPRYMLPNIYRQKQQLPHNANGKIDRKALKQEYDAEHNGL